MNKLLIETLTNIRGSIRNSEKKYGKKAQTIIRKMDDLKTKNSYGCSSISYVYYIRKKFYRMINAIRYKKNLYYVTILKKENKKFQIRNFILS